MRAISATDLGNNSAVWFKVQENGRDGTSDTWGATALMTDGGSVTYTVPECIESGAYLVRHEIIALHSAGTSGGGEFPPHPLLTAQPIRPLTLVQKQLNSTPAATRSTSRAAVPPPPPTWSPSPVPTAPTTPASCTTPTPPRPTPSPVPPYSPAPALPPPLLPRRLAAAAAPPPLLPRRPRPPLSPP